MKKIVVNSFLLLMPLLIFSQNKLEGIVLDGSNINKKQGLEGASVHWLNTSVGTVTNFKGAFVIPYKKTYKKLIISYLGFKTDTISVFNLKPLNHSLKVNNSLKEVVLKTEKEATYRSSFSTINQFQVNSEELLKAACCNLAESFETNPSIDVSFTDALTGTKQIQMLGLKSPYLLITQENIPSVRGASQVYGLTFTPGTWVESIQISKGAGSVINGFESISGQINTELVKPLTDNTFFLNTYGSVNGRLEVNTHFNHKISKKIQTGFYLHGNHRGQKFDRNKDDFLDIPLSNQFNVMNRWQFTDPENGWVSFLNFRYLKDKKQTGAFNFNPVLDRGTNNAWGSEIDTKRLDTSAKLGYVFPDLPYQSVGFQFAYSNHQQDSYFGLSTYNITHKSIYSNIIFNSIIGDTKNKFKTGISFAYDIYDELIAKQQFNEDFYRKENSVGAFFEYAFDNLENFSLNAGVRIDTHNLLGNFLTPRLHVRYAFLENSTLRASIGKGRRSANIFAENQQLFASSRQININDTGGNIYGLHPEIAWNYGVSYLQKFKILERKGDITFDFYVTDFINQVVVDWENPQEISFYDLNGKSVANSFQVEVNYNLAKRLHIRSAYKYFDVVTDFNSGSFQKPIQPKNRFFANASYETKTNTKFSKWKFDATFNHIGKQRLPNTSSNPLNFQLPAFSNEYQLVNIQTTKVFSNKFEIYGGAENITNVKQQHPVLANNEPFGAYFDTSIVYAPIFGRTIYAGLRFKIK